MLTRPRPGADRNNIRNVLRETPASKQRTSEALPGAPSILRYLERATDAARILRSQVSDRYLDHLVITRRYQALLGSCGTLAGTDQQRLVNDLVDLEITERIQAFEEAEAALDAQIGRWNAREWFVVADSSFYIHNPGKLANVDLHKVLGLPSGDHIRLLFPIVVVDELDGLKEAGKQRAHWRASHTLGLLDATLAGSTFGVLRRADPVWQDGEVRGEVDMEIVLDPPGHVRLPIPDDEIIDRAVAIQPLAARDAGTRLGGAGQTGFGRAGSASRAACLPRRPA